MSSGPREAAATCVVCLGGGPGQRGEQRMPAVASRAGRPSRPLCPRGRTSGAVARGGSGAAVGIVRGCTGKTAEPRLVLAKIQQRRPDGSVEGSHAISGVPRFPHLKRRPPLRRPPERASPSGRNARVHRRSPCGARARGRAPRAHTVPDGRPGVSEEEPRLLPAPSEWGVPAGAGSPQVHAVPKPA